MSTPEFPTEFEQTVDEQPTAQLPDSSHTRRDFFKLGAGIVAHITPEIGVSTATAATVAAAEVKLNRLSAKTVAKLAHGVSDVSTAASYGNREMPVLDREISRRTIAPLLGVVALSKVPVAKRGLKSFARNFLWNM